VRRSFWYLTITVVLIVGTFVATLASDTKPVLGLDLQGGIEVRLQQVGKQRPGAVLDKAVDIIRNRVNGLGVAETEVKRDGDQIVVDLPGVKDRDKARGLVGKTAELRFRPVLQVGSGATACKPASSSSTTSSSSTSSTTSTSSSSTSSTTASPSSGPGKSIRAPSAGGTTAATTATTAATNATTATTAAGTTPTTTPSAPALTTPAEDKRNATVVLCDRDGKNVYQLGPTALTGKLVTSADARFNSGGNGWVVVLNFNSVGQKKFNDLAASSYG
jgi:preprotein translocase subunit SecD